MRLLVKVTDCLISLFYIKPQQMHWQYQKFRIVLYLFSTSNHNIVGLQGYASLIVLYLFSTSNHNEWSGAAAVRAIVLYLFSTSNHNVSSACALQDILSYISFLHQTTTYAFPCTSLCNCLISLFYIKPQPHGQHWRGKVYCLISLFYIKPQPTLSVYGSACNCLISLFYIKPQRWSVSGVGANIVLYLFSTSNHN